MNAPVGTSGPNELPGLLWGFGFDRLGQPEALDPELAAAFSAKPGGWIWLPDNLAGVLADTMHTLDGKAEEIGH